MSILYTHIKLFLWKHWKALKFQWIFWLTSIFLPIVLFACFLCAVVFIPGIKYEFSALATAFQLFFIIYIQMCIFMQMIDEKECGIPEYIHIVSAYAYLNDTIRIIINILLTLVILGICLILIGVLTDFTEHISIACLIFFTVLYAMAVVSFAFMISSLFTQFSNFAGVLISIIALFVSKISKSLIAISTLAIFEEGFAIVDYFKTNGKSTTGSHLLYLCHIFSYTLAQTIN